MIKYIILRITWLTLNNSYYNLNQIAIIFIIQEHNKYNKWLVK